MDAYGALQAHCSGRGRGGHVSAEQSHGGYQRVGCQYHQHTGRCVNRYLKSVMLPAGLNGWIHQTLMCT